MVERSVGAAPFRQKTVEFTNRSFMPKIVLWQADLLNTTNVGAIVNPSNNSLFPVNRGSLTSNIFRLAGKELRAHLQDKECNTGDAIITSAYNLRQTQNISTIIHAVGPIYPDYQENTQDPEYIKKCNKAKKDLTNTYRSIFRTAKEYNTTLAKKEDLVTVIAMPAISTGTFNFPLEDSARIVRDTVLSYFNEKHRSDIKELRFILRDKEDYDIYEKVFSEPTTPATT